MAAVLRATFYTMHHALAGWHQARLCSGWQHGLHLACHVRHVWCCVLVCAPPPARLGCVRVIVTCFVCGCVGCARRYGSTLIADDREDVLADLAALGCPALPDFSVTCSDSYKTTNPGACASFCDTNVIPCLDGDTCHTGGNVVLVFFAVIIGAMGIGQANPSATSLAKARVAGYEMFSVIHREVAISTASCACRCRVVSCRVVRCGGCLLMSALTLRVCTPAKGRPVSKDHMRGAIRFNNVHFSYPSRPDRKVQLPPPMHALCGPQLHASLVVSCTPPFTWRGRC